MPRGDRTGPEGMGPKTGRGLGFCSGSSAPGYVYPSPGQGFGRGFGRGPGLAFRWGRTQWGSGPYYQHPVNPYFPAPTREEELNMLQSQAKDLQQTLNQIQKCISELENDKK